MVGESPSTQGLVFGMNTILMFLHYIVFNT